MSRKVLQDQDYNSQSRIRNLLAPVNDDEPARLAEVKSAIEGLAYKDDARVGSTGNINLAAPGASHDGVTFDSLDRFVAKDQTTNTENGIYIWNGAAVAATRALDASTFTELEGAVVTVTEGTANAGTTWRQTQVNGVLGTNAILWTDFGTAVAPASETVAGKIEIATQAETDTGTDDARAITPLKLATWSGRVRKATGNIGDGASTQYDATHNFNTRNVQVALYRNASPWDNVGEGVDIERPDANTVRFRFSAAPTSNQFSFVIWA